MVFLLFKVLRMSNWTTWNGVTSPQFQVTRAAYRNVWPGRSMCLCSHIIWSHAQTQKIPWKRTTVQVSAIVASILLAFATDAWWEERTERVRADELLLSLELEWSTDVHRIDERLNEYDRAITAMIRFLDAHSTGASNLSPSDAVEIIRNMRRWSTFKPSVAAYEVLLAYGLDRIEDRDLRLAVASWPSVTTTR